MANIKTVLHTYLFDVTTATGAAQHKELCDKLTAQGLECFISHGGDSHYLGGQLDGKAVELETEHLFDNQWNSAPIPGFSEKGYRLFNWAEDYNSKIGAPPGIKRGHYLEQTEEMKDVLRNTHKCGYCGHMEPAAKGYVFCPKCIGSEYLTKDHLKLTRMRPVSVKGNYPELSQAELDNHLPVWIAAQTKKKGENVEKLNAAKRLELEKSRDEALKHAVIEHDGFIWFMDRDINVHNCIYYKHNQTFSFGWRSPVDPEIEKALLEIVSEFPFKYEIKCADGRVLKNQ